ncbi:hypothetical protein [Lichenibacterium dinghuense]|uniref:hypothetical protein n=1 Tax=Lichenibacterium dinghuense TaxID=2895977 RepID=UPI001F290F4D|nr:hypothetical protein [Lichenibacterium sp. 6Y81]
MVRRARVADVEAVAAIGAPPGFRRGTLRLPRRSPEATRRFLDGLAPDESRIVDERDGAVPGIAGWSRFRGRRSHGAGIVMARLAVPAPTPTACRSCRIHVFVGVPSPPLHEASLRA